MQTGPKVSAACLPLASGIWKGGSVEQMGLWPGKQAVEYGGHFINPLECVAPSYPRFLPHMLQGSDSWVKSGWVPTPIPSLTFSLCFWQWKPRHAK